MLMQPDGRLTREGRLFRTFLILALVVTGVVVGTQAFADGPTPPVRADTYSVSAGETLWSIAGTVAGPGESTRDVVSLIMDLNGMESATIYAGDQILVPASP